MAESPSRSLQAASFKEFCQLMTKVAENQLDFHRETYYPICVSEPALSLIDRLAVSMCAERELREDNGVLPRPETNQRGNRHLCQCPPRGDAGFAKQAHIAADDPLCKQALCDKSE